MQPCIYSPATRRNSPSDLVLFNLGGCNRTEPTRGHRGAPSGPARRRRRGEGRRSRAGAQGLLRAGLRAAGPSAGFSFLFPFSFFFFFPFILPFQFFSNFSFFPHSFSFLFPHFFQFFPPSSFFFPLFSFFLFPLLLSPSPMGNAKQTPRRPKARNKFVPSKTPGSAPERRVGVVAEGPRPCRCRN